MIVDKIDEELPKTEWERLILMLSVTLMILSYYWTPKTTLHFELSIKLNMVINTNKTKL